MKCTKCLHFYRMMVSETGYNPSPCCHLQEDTGRRPQPLTQECFEPFTNTIRNGGENDVENSMSIEQKYRHAILVPQAISQQTGSYKDGSCDEWSMADAFGDCRSAAFHALVYLGEPTKMPNKNTEIIVTVTIHTGTTD